MTAPVNAVPPVIALITPGVPTTHFAFSVTGDGSWTGTAPLTYAYQWMRDGVDIPGATMRTSYVSTIADSGKMLSCRVTVTNVDGSASAVSNAVGPVTTYFQQEIDAVDPTKTLIFVINTSTYALFEFSYSGLTITGGSELGCEYGASWLLEAMGFRWYASPPWATVRPTSINVGLTKAKSTHWMPTNSIGLVYGHSWPAPWNADINTLNLRQFKWCILNGFQTQPFPSGHRWLNVVSNNKGFFANYPQLLKSGNPNDTSPDYALNTILPATADYNRLVQINAAHLLRDGLNEWRRTHFDPADGDSNIGDLVWTFSRDVNTAMRAGTAAISWPEVTLAGITYPAGSILAQTGVPDCEIGVYGYANHRLPPTVDCKPVYAMVSLAFSRAGFNSWEDFVAAYGLTVSHVLLREYWDTEVWSQSQPLSNGRMFRGYFDFYDSFHASGAIGVQTEYAANWWLNLVGTRYGMQKCKTGVGTYDDALDDIMAKLFSPGGVEDAAMRDLYDFFGSPGMRYNRLSLRICCDKIAVLPTSWYKTFLQQWMIIVYKRMYLPPQMRYKAKVSDLPSGIPPLPANVVGSYYIVREFTPYRKFVWDGTAWIDSGVAPDDPYPAAYSSMMANVVGTRMDEVIHSYAFARQHGRTFITVNYPQLAFEPEPHPEFYLNPTVFTTASTNTEFAAAHAQLIADTPHDTDFDDPNVVLIRGIKTVFHPTTYADGDNFAGRQTAIFAFIGPGKIICTELGGAAEVDVVSFGSGLHYYTASFAYWVIRHEGGELFMDTMGGTWKDPYAGPVHWLYIPTRAANAVPPTVTMETVSRWTFYDKNDAGVTYRLDLYPKNVASPNVYVPPTYLGPGQIMVDNGNTTGPINNTGANRWLSMKPGTILIPKPFADEDFPKMAHVNVVP